MEKGVRTPSFPIEYTGSECSGAYAVALVVTTILPPLPCLLSVLNAICYLEN